MHESKEKLDGQAYIEKIRRTKFMIGMELSADAEIGAESMRHMLNNALRLLSDDLYSKETHYILELIQNADDNNYDPSVTPEVRLSLVSNALSVWNNEIGFSEENVYALCSVGDSTKAKKHGFIGEKGIGFKSVFQVSDTPQIHSNGFHFSFDMSKPDELLGYVVPHWTVPDESISAVGTTIVLPAKDGKELTDAILAELDPKLLLFLRKLRRIELVRPGGKATYERSDIADLVVLSIEEPGDAGGVQSSQQFVRASHTVGMTEASDEKRPDSPDSELVLAFPVDEAGKAIAEANCSTFAFLPIRSFGLRFYVQGDFLLSSAREDIQTARPWNIALRDAIAPAFVASLDEFRSRPSLARSFLRFVPLANEVTDAFFSPIVVQTIAALAETECILGATGEWRRPADVMMPSPAFRRLVPADQAWELFGKDYPASDFDADTELLKKLGCEPLYYTTIVSVFTKRDGAWVRARGTAWLVEFYAYLSNITRKSLLDAKIREVACLPLSDGTLALPQAGTVFYPLAAGRKFGFESELRILDDEFLRGISALEADVESLLHDLGAKSPDPYALICDHVMPLHEGNRWLESDFEALIGHVRYVQAMLDAYRSGAKARGIDDFAAMERLRTALKLKSKKLEDDKWTFNGPKEMYLASEYEPDFDIEALAYTALDASRLTSADYLPPVTKKTDAAERAAGLLSWRDFLLLLGVNPSPRLIGSTNNFLCSSELEHLLKSEDHATRRRTLECLDRHWGRYVHRVTYGGSTKNQPRYWTGFATTLRGTIAPNRQKRGVALSDCFYGNDEVRQIFGNAPTFVDAELNSDGFLDTCGIVHRVDAAACIARLKQLADSDKPSVGALRTIYRHLDLIFDEDPAGIRKAFGDHSLIFARSDSSWRKPEEVVWSSQGEFLNAHYPQLHSQYADAHGFFVKKLGVANELSVAAAVAVLPTLSSSTLSAEVQSSEALRIYVRATRDLAASPGWRPSWFSDFQTRSVYLNHRGEMVANDGRLFVDDRPGMSALFRHHDELSFLAIPAARLPQIRALLDAAVVPLLSERLVLTLADPAAGKTNADLTSKVRGRYRSIARLVYAHSHPAFERAKDASLWRQLSLLEVIEVEVLTLEAALNDVVETTQGDVVISGTTAYARVGTKGVTDRLAREICGLLRVPSSLADGVSRVLLEGTAQGVEDYLEIKGVSELPEDDAAQLTLEQAAQASDVSEEPAVRTEGESEVDDVPDSVSEVGAAAAPEIAPPLPATAQVASAAVSAPSTGPATSTPPASTPVPKVSMSMPTRSAPSTNSPASNPAADPPKWHGGASPGRTITSPVGGHSSSGAAPRGNAPTKFGASRNSDRSRRSSRRAHAAGGRLISYAESASHAGSLKDPLDGIALASNRDATAQAAVGHFLATQAGKWASLEEMPPNNKGFDIRATAHDGRQHFIEVKGQSEGWTLAGVALTPSELLCAAEHREQFWLCVVEYARTESARVLHLVNNPFGATNQFRFDSGWRGIATTEVKAALAPAPGLRIEMDGVGTGTIFSVKKAGSLFCKVHVFLSDGSQVHRVFDPAKMRLSTGT